MECPDRLEFERYLTIMNEPNVATKNSTEIKPPTVKHGSEWDNLYCKSYNPEQVIVNKPVIRRCVGMTPAERREFYEQEKRRLRDLKSANEQAPVLTESLFCFFFSSIITSIFLR